jgi:hypothetical protein
MSLKNPVTPPGIDPGTVRLVAQRLNHYTTPDPRLGLLPGDKASDTWRIPLTPHLAPMLKKELRRAFAPLVGLHGPL